MGDAPGGNGNRSETNLPKSMVLSFHANQCYGINHIAQALQQLDIDCREIRKSFVTLQPPIELQIRFINAQFHAI